MESAVPQEKNYIRKEKKPRMKLEHAPEALAHPPSHPHAQCQFWALPPYLHPHALWTSLLMPWDFVCIHSSIYTWARHTFIYFLFMYVCVGLHVCALKLRGEDAFHFCPQMCCKGMLIIPRFTCMLVHPLQPYLLVSCSCKSLDTLFLSCGNKGHTSSSRLSIVFVQLHCATEICCVGNRPACITYVSVALHVKLAAVCT